MHPIKLVLVVREEEYIEPFLHYVHTSEYERSLKVIAFSKAESFSRYLEQFGNDVDAVLCEPSFLQEGEIAKHPNIRWVLLGESAAPKLSQSLPQLDKYQSLHQLLITLVEWIGGGQEQKRKEDSTQVIGVYSAIGGSGKTTVSLNLTRQWAAEGRSVFYLNLETAGSGLGFTGPDSEQDGLARLLYDLKAANDRQEVLKTPVSAYAYRHPEIQGDTFAPVDNLDELLEMRCEDTVLLIDYLVDSGMYDVVIIDTDAYPDGRVKAVLQKADQIVWLVVDDHETMRKTGVWLGHLERTCPDFRAMMQQKLKFVLNRYTGSMQVEMSAEIKLAGVLPLISAWKHQIIRQGELPHSPIYQRDVMKLGRELLGGVDRAAMQGG
ncbi:hypothetical protein [Paenibacillus sanguinis]|uniref:hypothetical protein n=1 Tax=Paenibacillus sanguinis TaxID=225906 RepID=UPI0003668E8C|nr:hypothetical protein [Paenibacillus sanguinis]